VRDFECEICRPDGVWVWLMRNARAVRDAQGELLRYEGTIEDITERKDAEQRINSGLLRSSYVSAESRSSAGPP
jgi:hypothetical protein